MTTFKVWAPFAQSVGLSMTASGLVHNMLATDDGWWSIEAEAPPGTDYGFVLDGQGPFPDPRSPWQPNGIDGPSRTVDHAGFAWADRRWQAPPLASALIYELHVGTFTPAGTFEAAVEKLDYLAELGVSHVEVMPVAQFSGSHGWGYDGVDLYAPHQDYGGPNGFKCLVDACHARGLAVILDVVYNHLGPAGNYLERYGPYFTQRYATPWGKAVNFDDNGSDEVRRFFIDNALMWLRDYHVDALRLDAVHAILDESAVHFLEQLQVEVERLSAELGRHFVLIAESSLNDPRLLWDRQRGGYGLGASWTDDLHHSVHSVLTGEREGYYADFGGIDVLAKALRTPYVYDGIYSRFRGRRHGRKPEGLSGDRFVVSIQNHDQIGNRAAGERLSHLCSIAQQKIAATLLFTCPFVPMIFQGEEWAASTPFLYFTDHQDPELGRAVTQGRRREFEAFGWSPDAVADPQAEQTFLHSKLKWQETGHEPHATMLRWYRDLIDLRRRYAHLRDGRYEQAPVETSDKEQWLKYQRGKLLVLVNFSLQSVELNLPDHYSDLILASDPACGVAAGTALMPAESVAVIVNNY